MAANISDYEKKLMEMQYHMKENQLYMQDYFDDLDKWTSEMKTKEKEVLEKGPTSNEKVTVFYRPSFIFNFNP